MNEYMTVTEVKDSVSLTKLLESKLCYDGIYAYIDNHKELKIQFSLPPNSYALKKDDDWMKATLHKLMNYLKSWDIPFTYDLTTCTLDYKLFESVYSLFRYTI